MYKYTIKRILLMIPTLAGAAILIFGLMRLIPGDICELRMAGEGAWVDPSAIEACRNDLGLNDHFLVQFWDFVWGFIVFDLGPSMWTGKPITTEIALRFELSVEVAILATITGVIIALPLGIISAVKPVSYTHLTLPTICSV